MIPSCTKQQSKSVFSNPYGITYSQKYERTMNTHKSLNIQDLVLLDLHIIICYHISLNILKLIHMDAT